MECYGLRQATANNTHATRCDTSDCRIQFTRLFIITFFLVRFLGFFPGNVRVPECRGQTVEVRTEATTALATAAAAARSWRALVTAHVDEEKHYTDGLAPTNHISSSSVRAARHHWRDN